MALNLLVVGAAAVGVVIVLIVTLTIFVSNLLNR